MMITNKTVIGFKVPDDYKEEQAFISFNDMSEWVQNATSGWVYYTKQNTYFSKMKENDNDAAIRELSNS